MKTLLLVFLGGGAGSAFRFLISKFFYINKGSFPWSTLLANYIGCLLIGLMVGWALKNDSFRSDLYFFTAVGFCGGLTTFSTFSLEKHVLFALWRLPQFDRIHPLECSRRSAFRIYRTCFI